MKKIYQIPETEIVLSKLRNGIMQGGGGGEGVTPEMSYPEIDNGGSLSNEGMTFDEGEITTGAKSSLWED